MKKIHYQNVGFPRTGTSWLWQSLTNHPEVFKSTSFLNVLKTKNFILENKEPKFSEWTDEIIENRIPQDVTPIIKKYSAYDISLCFNTFDFLCAPDEISRIANYTTHASLTIRNPFEIVSSYYAYSRFILSEEKQNMFTIDYLINLFDFSNTVERWLSFENKFKILVYDDLLNDQTMYYKEVCNFIGIEPHINVSEKINSISYFTDNYSQLNFTKEQTVLLNAHIDKFSILLDRDFTHWKSE